MDLGPAHHQRQVEQLLAVTDGLDRAQLYTR